MNFWTIPCATALAVLLATACAKEATPEPIIATERAFAADGYEHGVKASFLRYAAPDAILFAPDPVNVRDHLSKQPDLDPDEPRRHLVWWPLWAGVSRAGDIGFTTGPYGIEEARIGHYFTVWKKQPDETWKWVFDAGVETDPSTEDPQSSPADLLPLAAAGSRSPEIAVAEVTQAEAALADIAKSDAVASYLTALAPDARVHSAGPPPAKSASEHAGVIEARGAAMSFAPLAVNASQAGDFVWTYGEARWTSEGVEKRGYYARIWQKRANGWAIVFDQVAPRRTAGE